MLSSSFWAGLLVYLGDFRFPFFIAMLSEDKLYSVACYHASYAAKFDPWRSVLQSLEVGMSMQNFVSLHFKGALACPVVALPCSPLNGIFGFCFIWDIANIDAVNDLLPTCLPSIMTVQSLVPGPFALEKTSFDCCWHFMCIFGCSNDNCKPFACCSHLRLQKLIYCSTFLS